MFLKSEEREKELLSPAIKNRNFISESLKKEKNSSKLHNDIQKSIWEKTTRIIFSKSFVIFVLFFKTQYLITALNNSVMVIVSKW